ncbi:hypothetical protein B566_EDAN010777 [Ephemera danica]|nr:hypothetical protein B566_EDAN010777 [Ephemera danica]
MMMFAVVSILHAEDETMLEAGLWLATVACLAVGLLLAALAAIFAVLNTAATPARALPGVPGLYLWNLLAMFTNIAAVSLWAVQYHRTLQHNVMTKEDINNMWSSDGMAAFGFSFWRSGILMEPFVVGAIFVHFFNLMIIYIGTRERDPTKNATPIVEEKTNGAIMLY